MNGFIKLHRKFTEWGWYQDPNTKIVFLHMLIFANWRDREYRGYKVPRGSGVFGRKRLAKELRLTEQQIRTCVDHLKNTQEVTIKTTNKFTIYHIENYDKYQLIESEVTSKTTNKQPTSNQQVTTPKEGKKVRKKEKKGRAKQTSLPISLNLDTFSWVNITPEIIERWKGVYPNINIDLEMKKAAEWISSNPTRVKKNWAKYLTGWFSRTNPKDAKLSMDAYPKQKPVWIKEG